MLALISIYWCFRCVWSVSWERRCPLYIIKGKGDAVIVLHLCKCNEDAHDSQMDIVPIKIEIKEKNHF